MWTVQDMLYENIYLPNNLCSTEIEAIGTMNNISL